MSNAAAVKQLLADKANALMNSDLAAVAVCDIQIEQLLGILAQDADRLDWLVLNSKEELLHPSSLNSEFPDMRTHWKLPVLICSGPVGGFLELRQAIDCSRKDG